jgi:hypothetical protein
MPDTSATARAACPAFPTLQRFARAELSETDAGTIEGHVAACPDCQQAVDELMGGQPGPTEPDVAPASGSEVELVRAALSDPDGEADARPELPGYETLERAGAGGMGEVWRVRDVQFDRPLAIKVLGGRNGLDPRWVRRFEEEARITARLTHPFVVPVHAMGRLPDGRPYYTMKLVEGRTLASLIAGGPAAGGRRAALVRVFGQVCQGVAFAHSRGVIHRDLKPANVMVGAHGEVQVMDWGLAKVLTDGDPAAEPLPDDDAGDDHTRPGSVLGTSAYMPPEQARGWLSRVDRRADVFGLGGILCQILTGEPPYSAPSGPTVRSMAEAGQLGPARERLRACGADPELVKLAEWCLAPEPGGRPADAGVVAEAVAGYLARLQERAEQERLEEERERVRRAARRRWRVWVAVAAVAAAAVAGGVVGRPLIRDWYQQRQLRAWAARADADHAGYKVTASFRAADDKCNLVVARGSAADDPASVITAVFHDAERRGVLDRIYGVDLTNLGLTRVPPEVLCLPALEELRLGGNQLTALPADVGRLARLTKLVLAQNQLEALPPEVERLAALEELDLSGNSLRAVPPEVFRLTNLTYLSLKRNEGIAAGGLPPAVGDLVSLAHLDLAWTNLDRLPPEIGRLANLTRLHLPRNKLTALPPEVGRLAKLTSLHLSNNPLARLPPEVGDLSELAELYAADCGLTELPPEVGRLANLTTAHLSGNRLAGVPAEVAGLRKLRTLDLRNNVRDGALLTELPPEVMGPLRKAVLLGAGSGPAGGHVHGSGKGGGK